MRRFFRNAAITTGLLAGMCPVGIPQAMAEECPASMGVQFCIDEVGEAFGVDLFLVDATMTPIGTVYAYFDIYAIAVGQTTVTVPCVTLAVNSSEASPCAIGTRVSRQALIELPVGTPQAALGEPILRVAICNARLTATVAGIGVTNAPFITACPGY